MKNGNAIQKHTTTNNRSNQSIKPLGTRKSFNNKCPEGWYCFNDNCLECVPNHVTYKDERNIPEVMESLLRTKE